MRKYVFAILEVARLALAILVYTWLEPAFTKLFHPADYLGMATAAVISAAVLLGLSAVLVPWSEVRVILENYSNGNAVTGPVTEIEAQPMQEWVRQWQLNVQLECTSPVGRWISRSISSQGLKLILRIPYQHLVLHSGDPGADEQILDDGLVITLNRAPNGGSWAVVPMTLDTKDIANGTFAIEARLEFTGKLRWLKSWMLYPVQNVKEIKLVRIDNAQPQ